MRWVVDGDYEFARKFKEAEHFFNQMISNANDLNLESFGHNLSAFITAARAITMIMKAQYGKEKWYQNWAMKMDGEIKTSLAFKFLNDKRIETLKIKQIEVVPDQTFRFNPPLVGGIKIDGKMVMEHTVTMKREKGVLKVIDVDGNPNPKNVSNEVRFIFSGTRCEILGFGKHILDNLSKYTRELITLVSNNTKPE